MNADSGSCSTGDRSSLCAFQCSAACVVSSAPTWPTISLTVRKPNCAISSRTSSAMNMKKFSTNSGLPLNRSRSTGFWVATPTGQVSRWQTRIMMQPDTTSGAVAKPNSSAPSSAAITTSRPVLSWPSTWTTMRSRNPLSSNVCCVSARPSSHGAPACFMRRQRRRAGAAVVAGDQHHVGVRLGHARGDRADAVLGRPASRARAPAGWRSSGRGSAAPDPRSSRCRGAAAARSGRHPAWSAAPRRPTGTPCDPEAGRPHRVSRPGPS